MSQFNFDQQRKTRKRRILALDFKSGKQISRVVPFTEPSYLITNKNSQLWETQFTFGETKFSFYIYISKKLLVSFALLQIYL